MKYLKWIVPSISAAVASVAVFVIWSNTDRGGTAVETVVREVDSNGSGDTGSR